MELNEFFPMWNELAPADQELLLGSSSRRDVRRGEILHNGSADCTGLFALLGGQLRSYIMSSDGREVTLYRLLTRDICLFSASCIMNSIQFEITIEAEKDSQLIVIPADVYKSVMERSAPLANYTSQLMAARFSEVMWLIEQIMWKSMDKRLAAFLLEESVLDSSNVIKTTHDRVAAHLGTAREVVTRMLKYLQSEGMIRMTRGAIELTDISRLSELAQ